MAGVLCKAMASCFSRVLEFDPVFGGVRYAHLFSFLCCVLFTLFVFFVCLVYPMSPVSLDCLRRVFCVPNVASFSELSSSCVLCTQCRQFLWILFVVCLVYPMLPVSLDCLRRVSCVPNVASFSGLSSLCVLCTQCCQFLWIVHSWLPLQFSLVVFFS